MEYGCESAVPKSGNLSVRSLPITSFHLVFELSHLQEQEETTDVGSSGSDGEATSASESAISGTEDQHWGGKLFNLQLELLLLTAELLCLQSIEVLSRCTFPL